ncbi:uracil-DNA glycosylase family protein [Sphingosinithalassobacter portus]|uniref:uracil-DNA glycosylase family protein n=1 Tax=Stakelama portus TaxID=2676234 RepID=UPI000D6DECD9|nr:uracil-DNA glycosylase family protein [Sphingosinithalassobacter portus]
MGAEPILDWRAEAASTLEWWHDAGVDMLLQDAPRDWLTRAPPPAAATATTAATTGGGEAAAPEPLPQTLESFLAWRMSEHAPENGWFAPRVAPEGDPSAPLMIVTDMPESGNGESPALIGGAPGRLFDRMLAAIGMTRADVYIAPVAWAAPVATQLPPDSETRLADLARHHIALASPKQLLLLGRTTERLLLETDGADANDGLGYVNHSRGKMAAVACLHPRFLLKHPANKADAWKNLQMLLIRGSSL